LIDSCNYNKSICEYLFKDTVLIEKDIWSNYVRTMYPSGQNRQETV